MDTSPECTKFVGKTDWGGYTWNTTLFSDPQAFVAKLHEMRGPTGIRLSLNFHPDSGIDMCQKYHNNMATALGMDPSKPLPDIDGLESLSETYVDAYFKYMIGEWCLSECCKSVRDFHTTICCAEPTCVDIAWTDTPKATTWTNWLYVRYPMKKGNRTINFSRYGGLGNHRTPTGFSGDTRRAWDTLEYEIFMTPRASNVGFGWWSHVREFTPWLLLVLACLINSLLYARILEDLRVLSSTMIGTQNHLSSFSDGFNSAR